MKDYVHKADILFHLKYSVWLHVDKAGVYLSLKICEVLLCDVYLKGYESH